MKSYMILLKREPLTAAFETVRNPANKYFVEITSIPADTIYPQQMDFAPIGATSFCIGSTFNNWCSRDKQFCSNVINRILVFLAILTHNAPGEIVESEGNKKGISIINYSQ